MAAPTTTYPPGTTFWETPDYKGIEMRNLNICLTVISTVVCGLRLYTRLIMTKTGGVDDIMSVVAWAFVVVLAGFDFISVRFGSGAHTELVPLATLIKFFSFLATQNLLYFWVVAVVRLSIVAFLPRLNKDRWYLYSVYSVGGVIFVQTVVCFFYKLTECTPIKDVWAPPFQPGLNCVSTAANNGMMIGHSVIGILVDLTLIILPIVVIYKKMILSRQVIQIILVFTVGIFVVITGVVRLYLIVTLNFANDSTYKMSTIGLWTDLESHVGYWVACFPALQPILKMISYKLGFRSKLTSYGDTTTSNTKATPGTSRSVTRSKHGYLRSSNGVDATDTDSDSQKGIVSTTSADHAIELGKIRKVTETVVRFDQPHVVESDDRRYQESWANV
ncbi:hypothetical protein BP6252_11106 [Coleophoma cylindrospora]|uniref:Rhodopsin domain-containing protein n=1 Tax=Coleophoma cylindrospora TaxID=1849047 RepID=A0A3D8QPB1_9HELO|nr:hypothetical protein BP6252_11106 [Coleophoma cylindrospora]